MRAEGIEGFPFCGRCAPHVRECIATFRNAEQRERWKNSIARQREFARSAVIATTGAMTALGTEATGVGAAAVPGSIALARSVAQQAHASASVASDASRQLAPIIDASLVPVPKSSDTVFEDALGDTMNDSVVPLPPGLPPPALDID